MKFGVLTTPEEWKLVAPVVTGEFDNGMPVTPRQASFVVATDGARLGGFVHVEMLYRCLAHYVAPDYRGTRLAWQLMKETARRIPQGHSAVVFTDPEADTGLIHLLGGRDLGLHRILRRDF